MIKHPEEFEVILLKTIDEVLVDVLGERNKQVIYDYLEKKACRMPQIYDKLDVFSAELRNLLGPGRGGILGSAPILEETILRVLCHKIGVKYDSAKPFLSYVKELRETFNQRKSQILVRKMETEVKIR
ncbi:MAG TPA: hypothetical protein VEC97_01945 [Candidatus Acidoferrales bacterium]|nr:hypothetical protein [Candidatus Acidoferrales bacterium]